MLTITSLGPGILFVEKLDVNFFMSV